MLIVPEKCTAVFLITGIGLSPLDQHTKLIKHIDHLILFFFNIFIRNNAFLVRRNTTLPSSFYFFFVVVRVCLIVRVLVNRVTNY